MYKFHKIIAGLCCLALLFTDSPFIGIKAASVTQQKQFVNLQVEGKRNTVFSGSVPYQNGDSVSNILISALKNAGMSQIPFTGSSSADTARGNWPGSFFLEKQTYGWYIQRIGDDNGFTDANKNYYYWSFYINGQSAPAGIDSVYPHAGDNIVIAFCDGSAYLPALSLSPRRPVKGQTAIARVTAQQNVYSADWSSSTIQTVPIAGANIIWNGKSYTTDEKGSVSIVMPSSAGTYDITVQEKDDAAGYPNGIHVVTPVTVLDSLPSGDSGNGYNLSREDSIDVCSTDPVSAQLETGVSGNAKNAVFSSEKQAVVRNALDDFELNFAQGTTVSGPLSWDSSFRLPQKTDASSVSVPNATIKMAVSVGAGVPLSLSKPARLVMPGQHGLSAGYLDEDGGFHRITRKLDADSAPDNVGSGYTAVYDNGRDLVLYTTHFSTFIAYKDNSSDNVTDASIQKSILSCAGKLSSDDSRWAAFAMARAGKTPFSGCLAGLKQDVTQNGGNFDTVMGTSCAALMLEANGYNASNFCGVNLFEKIYNDDNVTESGLNGPDFALIALDSKKINPPSGAKWTEQKLIDSILSFEHSDGSFALDKSLSGDPDMTAMTLIALASYRSDNNVAAAVNKALSWLSASQLADGGFKSSYDSFQETSESVSEIITALCSLGIDPKTDARFIKGGKAGAGKSPLDALLSYQLADGGFEHLSGSGYDATASEQALMALSAYVRFENSDASLYDLSDVSGNTVIKADAASNLPNQGTKPQTSGIKGPADKQASPKTERNPDTGNDSAFPGVAAVFIAAAFALPILKKRTGRVR